MTRVLWVSRTRYRLPLDGQVERKWDALARVVDIRVLATGANGAQRDDRFMLVRGRTPAFYLALPVHVARELRVFQPDVVVAQSPYEAAAVLVGRRLARLHPKLVLEVHGDWRTATRLYGSPLRRLVEPVSRAVARTAVRRADAVRTVSPFTTGLVRELGVEPAASFTAYTDTDVFHGQRVPLPDRPRALFVGVLERYKNVESLAAAWREVAARLPEPVLHVVGRGRERAVIERLVAELPGRVKWDEWIPSDRVAAALDDASVLVLPSFSEGLPRIVVESFSRGRGVVATRAGGTPDIVEDEVSGLLVPSNDPPALATALCRVLADHSLAQSLGDGAYAASSRWVQSADDYADRVQQLVDGVRR